MASDPAAQQSKAAEAGTKDGARRRFKKHFLEPGMQIVSWLDRVAATIRKAGYADVAVRKQIKLGTDTYEGEERTHFAMVDITFGRYVVEAATVYDWDSAVGSVLHYSHATQSKAVVMLLHDPDDPLMEWCKRSLAAVVANNTPPIQMWIVDIAQSTLDMGDGRVVALEA